MRYLLLIAISLALAACQNMQQGESDFYTWVDETGQIRTIKKPTKDLVSAADAEVISSSSTTETQAPVDFDPSQFTPSEEIDKKINHERLYAWQEADGTQIVREESRPEQAPEQTTEAVHGIQSKSFRIFREGKQVLFEDVNGVSIDLSRYYQFNTKAETDYALIELISPIKRIAVKSFIKNDTVAMPQIIPLTRQFEQRFSFDNPFTNREVESWYGYGYVHGLLNIPEQTQYLLLLPNPQYGVIETQDKLIKKSNLGSLVFESLN